MTPIEKTLHDKFVKHVRNTLEMFGVSERDVETRVRFIEFLGDRERIDQVSDLFSSMFYFLVSIKGPVDVATVLAVAKACDEYCTEEDAKEKFGDYEYMLGDGDDGGACQFEHGQFRIWLRGRKFQ